MARVKQNSGRTEGAESGAQRAAEAEPAMLLLEKELQKIERAASSDHRAVRDDAVLLFTSEDRERKELERDTRG